MGVVSSGTDFYSHINEGDKIQCEVVRGTEWISVTSTVISKMPDVRVFNIRKSWENYSSTLLWTCGAGFLDSRNFKLIKKEKGGYMNSLKEYISKHRDIFFTIGFILVLDHFVFNGAFKKKLEDFIHSFLDKQTVKEI